MTRTVAEIVRDAQDSAGYECDHGQMIRKTGVSQKGPWAGWFCPDKVRNCKPRWADAKAIMNKALDAWAREGTK